MTKLCSNYKYEECEIILRKLGTKAKSYGIKVSTRSEILTAQRFHWFRSKNDL